MDFKLAGLTAILLVGASGLAAGADTPVVESLCIAPDQAAETPRRRPGRSVDRYELPVCDASDLKSNAVNPWVDPFDLGAPVPDRWRIVELLGITTNLWDPYSAHNPLKGDLPMWGKDWFYSLIAISDTVIEPRRFPIPVGGATTQRPQSLDTIGDGDTSAGLGIPIHFGF